MSNVAEDLRRESVPAPRPRVKRWVRRVAIPYRGSTVTAAMGCLPCGIMIQLVSGNITVTNGTEEKIELRPGMVWVPNQELKKSTNGASGYMLCDDLYAAFRQSLLTSKGYGVGSDDPAAEEPYLTTLVHRAKGLAETTLRGKELLPSEQRLRDGMLTSSGAELFAKRNADKRGAGRELLGAAVTAHADARGRPNPPAAAMKIGHGIGHLLKRLYAIAKIDGRIVSRATTFGNFIEDHLADYDRLWADLKSRKHPERGGRVWRLVARVDRGLLPHALSYEKQNAENALVELRTLLDGYRKVFRRMQAAPFRRNASHAVWDLDAAMKLTRIETRKELEEALVRLRQGIRWIYCLNYLHVEILLPLSLHLARHGQVPPPFFGPAIDLFERKVAKCSDTLLARPVKLLVVRHVEAARHFARVDAWESVKLSLQDVASTL